MENLPTIVAVIIALSVASERLVEIIKGCSSYLNTKLDDTKEEGKRAAAVQAIAVAASIFTALLCWPVLTRFVPVAWSTLPVILALGFLASGGSAFWNSVQTYLLRIKDVQTAAARTAEKASRQGAPVEKEVKLKIVA